MLLNISASPGGTFQKSNSTCSSEEKNQSTKQISRNQCPSTKALLFSLLQSRSSPGVLCVASITVQRITEQFLLCRLEEIQTPYQSPKTLPHVLCPPNHKQSLPSLWYCPWVYCLLLLDAPKSVWICSCCLFFIFWTISFFIIISSALKTAYDYNNPNLCVLSEISF